MSARSKIGFQDDKDRHWKPFVAHLFGFNERPIERKYELDEDIERLKVKQADQQTTVAFSEDQLPELTARIGVLQQQVDELEAALDAFNFDAEEKKIVRELVDSIEQDIADTNDRLYNIRYDIRQINSALDHKDKFDLSAVDEIFEEVGIHFPGQLRRNYEDLVAFNKGVTHERNVALRGRLKTLVTEEASLAKRKIVLDEKRQAQLKCLRSTDTFEKFKDLQRDLTHQRAQVVYLDEQRKQLEHVAKTAREVREAERDRGRVVDEIKAMVARPTPVYERFFTPIGYPVANP